MVGKSEDFTYTANGEEKGLCSVRAIGFSSRGVFLLCVFVWLGKAVGESLGIPVEY